jgi:hypothetical protein
MRQRRDDLPPKVRYFPVAANWRRKIDLPAAQREKSWAAARASESPQRMHNGHSHHFPSLFCRFGQAFAFTIG